jgi:hypothetical protein
MYRNAVFYFLAALLILIGGFWTSYFSRLGGDISFGHHFHGISMLAWMLLLIVQAWFIRKGKRPIHRTTGKISFLLAPMVVVSGIYITLENIAKRDIPYSPGALSIFWFSIFLMVMFASVYWLAIRHRKDMQLHQRYMASTALVFLVPGLARLSEKIGATFEIWTPSFFQTMLIPGIITVLLIVDDYRKGKIRSPYIVVALMWTIGLLGFMHFHKYSWLTDLANWSRTLVG